MAAFIKNFFLIAYTRQLFGVLTDIQNYRFVRAEGFGYEYFF